MAEPLIAVVGGGAAGLAAAVSAAEALSRCAAARVGERAAGGRGANAGSPAGGRGSGAGGPGERARVVLLEADERVGRSILATGNGRCNFSNACVDPALYRNGAHVAAVLDALEERWAQAGLGDEAAEDRDGDAARASGPGLGSTVAPAPGQPDEFALWPVPANAVQAFFADRGLCWREESEGRLYPLPNKATAVLDVLRAAAEAAGVDVRCGTAVERVEPAREPGGRLTLRLADGRLERADAVIVAVGGAVPRTLLPEALVATSFHDPVPTLGPVATAARHTRPLDNIRVRGALELWRDGARVAREKGEVMFRKYGVSGIAAFNLSRLAEPGDELAVDFLPPVAPDAAEAFLTARAARLAASLGRAPSCADVLRGLVLAPVAHELLAACRLGEDAPADGRAAAALASVLKGLRLPVEGLGDARQCQVRRGGVDVGAVDARTGECRAVPGLYLAGEALDVDAPCGGYNLHWAWASGLLAGLSAADAVRARADAAADDAMTGQGAADAARSPRAEGGAR
ncbi:MAG: FAD-dependent oxidoreductase [Eggerthellaceae bacterium]|nr:FAD-dependent oxidoreductase [Eggerthellaceae bacterium]